MDSRYREVSHVLRSGVELMEDSSQDEYYTRDIESFVENIFEPVLYEEISSLDELNTEYGSIEEVYEEFEYWLERFGKRENDLYRDTERHIENFQRKLEEDFDIEEVNTILAPAVSGIPWGLIAKDTLEADNFGIIGYQEEHGGKEREVAFNTLEQVKGDLLITDDLIASGSSIAGILDNLENHGSRNYVIDAKGNTYEVVENPELWRIKNTLKENPDNLLVNTREGIKKETTDYNLSREIGKAGIYAASTGLMAGGLLGLESGEADTLMYSLTFLTGLLGSAHGITKYH